MQNRESAKSLSIPQAVYDHYNANYSNVSYRDFRDKLVESSDWGRLSTTQSDESFIDATMNLLIDASFERSGAECYRGSEAQLMQQIAHLQRFSNRLS